MTTIIVFILVISVLVFVHEMGHFLVARWVGVRVKEFSIGMPPKALSIKRGDTEYKIGWLPLGGYVRLEGQNIDDEDSSNPQNYAAKNKAQRFLILVAGSAMNLVFALILMWAFLWVGIKVPAYYQSIPVISAVDVSSIAENAGLRKGDQIVSVQGEKVTSWANFFQSIETQSTRSDVLLVNYLRENTSKERTAQMDAKAVSADTSALGLVPYQPAQVGGFTPNSPAKRAGIEVGDLIKNINDEAVSGWTELAEKVQATKGLPVTLAISRNGEPLAISVKPLINDDGRPLIGITQPITIEREPPFSALYLAAKRLLDISARTFAFLGTLFTGKASFDALGGPVMIGAALGSAAQKGFSDLLFLTAFISLQLAIFNLLPIPALDGGHIFILGLEWVTRRPLSPKWRERIQVAGVIFLIGLILIVTLNDVLRLFSG